MAKLEQKYLKAVDAARKKGGNVSLRKVKSKMHLKFTKLFYLQGLVETLPSMNNGRARHGCGSYLSDNKVVRIISHLYKDN